jgi:phage tail sheath protein FI
MAYYVVPGVYFREIDLSEYASALSTSVCAIIGTAVKGPINVATYITSADQFVKTFGQPTSNSYMGYAALEFLKRGRALWVVRVCGGSVDGPPYTSATKASKAVPGAAAQATVTGSNSEYFTITAATGGTHTGTEVENFTLGATSNAFSFTLAGGAHAGTQTGSIVAGTYTAAALVALLNAATTAITFEDVDGKIRFTSDDAGGSTTITLNNTANEMYAVVGWTEATYTGSDGTDYLSVLLAGTGAGTQTFTLTAGTRSALQVAQDINATATDFVAAADSIGRVKLVKTQAGSTETLKVNSVSTCDTTLGLDNATHAGSDGTTTTLTVSANTEGTWANNYSFSLTDGTIGATGATHTGSATESFVLTIANNAYSFTVDGTPATGTIAIGTYTAASLASLLDTALAAAGLSFDAVSGKIRITMDQVGSGHTFSVNSIASSMNTTVGWTVGTYEGIDGTFKLTLYDTNNIKLEVFDNLSKDSSSSYFHETQLATSNYITSTDASAVSSLPINGDYVLVGGVSGITDVVDADYIGQVGGQTKTGLEIFSNPKEIDINILIVPGVTSEAVQNKMISVSEVDRRDCITILDTPYGLSVQNAVNFMNGEGVYSSRTSLNSSYAALYWPWIRIYDQYSAADIWLPSSGFVAAQMAYTDYIADPWFPPAGPQRGRLISALGIEYNPEEGDIELMYGGGNNLNPIRELDNLIQIYGQKTLQRATTAKDRVATRRMLCYAEKVVSTAVSQLVFEPDDATTWRRFVRLVTPLFESIKNRRGLVDFRVICDESTNTADLIAQNNMAGKILMQHTKYAEAIAVDFVSTPTGVSFTEVEY